MENNLPRIFSVLPPPTGRLRMVLDTDTYNEVDDQFALSYALASPERLAVEAIYAAPFHNERSNGAKDGMERSYGEICRLLSLMGLPHEGFAFPGSDRYLKDDPEHPPKSLATEDLIARARASSKEDPLYVVAIGAITNVASALLQAPDIVDKIAVVWLGGHGFHWQDTREFNHWQDVPASKVVLDSGVAFAMLPCMGVVSHLTTTLPELKAEIQGYNPICDALIENVAEAVEGKPAASRVIWDISTIAYLINRDAFTPSTYRPSPIATLEGTWSFDASRHLIDYVTHVHRDRIFADMFEKLRKGQWQSAQK